MEPDWDDFKVLLALARAGSVAGAARALGVDNSTVSRRLAALEDAVGARLLLRGGREFGWTAEGRAAIGAAESIETAVAQGLRTCRAARSDVSGSLRLSCPSGLVTPLAGMMLPAVREKHPALAIELIADNRTVDLAKGEADMALRMFRPTESGLVARRTFEMGWGVFASRAYLAEHGTPASADELAGHRLVLYHELLLRVPGPRWLEARRGPHTLFLRVDNTEVASNAIASGGGIGIVPCFEAVGRPDMVRVFPEPMAFNTGWIVYHEATRDTARVRAAVVALVEFFEAHAALFSGHLEADRKAVPR
jgi:DNA-binding transcriptional LysR family regulator